MTAELRRRGKRTNLTSENFAITMGKYATFLSLALLHILTMCEGREAGPQGVFEIRLKKFHNFNAADTNGRCCETGERSPTGGRCAGRCETKFRVCLKHYMAQVDTSLSSVCTFGEHRTAVLGSNNITINSLTPIRFDIDFKWPGTFSLIIEAWHENQRNNELRSVNGGETLLHRITKSNALDSGPAWKSGEDTKLEYEYRLVCAESYYGKDCDVICKPRDDNFGHYTCGRDGEKTCLPGWEKDLARGGYCTKPKCGNGCNKDNGYCTEPGECKCHEGWQGPECNQCKRYPGCVHGTCSAPYTCECKQGWGGLLCNKDLNFCTNNRPCHNGATCFNTGADYTCSCPIGFSGRNCETRVVNKCLENPCANSGDCVPGRNDNAYTCECKPGYYGPHCEFQADFDICSTNPCENSATCMSSMAGYTCTCPPGFEGRNCEINTNDCEVNPCRNGGTCFDFINSFKCICPNGYIGTHCEENYDDCRNDPCANGGTCADGVNDFTCTCTPGYTGKDCSLEVNECDADPCLNGGFCVDGNNTFSCRCLPRHSGSHCQILPDGTTDPKYYELSGVVPTKLLDDDTGNMALIVAVSVLVPVCVIVAAMVVFCMKQRRKLEQRRADFEAHLENELNAVNSINKSKMLDDHMIVNSLDYPRHKSINTNPNLADEEVFSAKDSAYASYNKSTKQLNTDNALLSRGGGGSGGYSDKLVGGEGQHRNSYHQQHLHTSSPYKSSSSSSSSSRHLAATKSTNLDLSSSTLCSSSSEKSSFKKELNREPLYSGSCGSASPAPSSLYGGGDTGGGACVPDDLLATEV